MINGELIIFFISMHTGLISDTSTNRKGLSKRTVNVNYLFLDDIEIQIIHTDRV